jgi:flagellar motor switch protein FliM
MAETPATSANDRLEQSEIDKLLAPQPAAAEEGSAFAAADEPAKPAKAEPYDFRNPSFLSELELRRLRALHEDFLRYLSARLSLHLRMEFGLALTRLTTETYSKFTDALANPTHISLFKVEPLVGVGLLELHPRLALTIADRLLGGRGHSVKAERQLTEIETALIEDVVGILLDEWCAMWKPDQELRPAVVGHESSGRFLQTSARDAIMLTLSAECTFGDCTEMIQLGVPYFTLEPLVKKIQTRRQKDAAVAPAPRRAEWQPAYDRITVPVRAEWNAFELALREIACLRVGDVLELPATLCAETQLLLNGTAKFVGTVGLDADRVAVQLTRKLPREDSSHGNYDGRKVS